MGKGGGSIADFYVEMAAGEWEGLEETGLYDDPGYLATVEAMGGGYRGNACPSDSDEYDSDDMPYKSCCCSETGPCSP
jgi:hypothetical protein